MRRLLRLDPHAVRRHGRLVATLFALELAVASLVTLATGWSLSTVFAERPLFDRAVAGDLVALGQAFDGRIDLLLALACCGAALALAWAVASWWLGAGLLGVLAGGRFGERAAARFWSFARLWLWSVLPWAVAGFVLLLGLDTLGAREILGWGDFFVSVTGRLLPGVIALAFVGCVVDHARVLLVIGPPAAGPALVGAARLVLGSAAPMLSFLAYAGAWLLVSLVYVLATAGHAWAGVGGALALFLFRQLVLGARFAARVALSAGQVAFVTERTPPSAP